MRAYVRVRQLTEEEYQELKRWERSRKMAVGKVKRARVVLLSNQGHTRIEIDQRLEMDERTVRRWMGRFNQLGIAGLAECPRKGRPRVYKAEEVSLVIETALTKPGTLGLPFGAWTLDRLVAYLSEKKGIAMSRSRMSEIFRNEGLRWRQQEGWVRTACRSRLRPKKGVIEQLYTDPPEHSVVLCVDEMGPLASRTYTGKELVEIHSPPARRAKVELDYHHRPKGGFVFGALQPSTGAVLTETYPRRIVGHYVEFLEKVEQWLPPEVKRVYAIVDNLYMHSAYDVMLFSLAYPRWEFVFQPKYTAYLNLIEPWWKTLRSLALKGRRFEVWTEMVEPVRKATDYWNEHKHPYVWGKRRRHRTPHKFGVAALPIAGSS